MRLLLLTAIVFCAAAAQDPAAPAFEAASVKSNNTGDGHSSSHTRVSNVQMTNMSLRSVIVMAYGIKDYQLEGPSWLGSEHFDIVAKAPVGTPEKQLMPMLKTLLKDRFKLESHAETKEFPVYALVVAKGGFKLTPVAAGGSGMDSSNNEMGGEMKATKTGMTRLAEFLSHAVDRPVIDATGIEGAYDFTLKYSRESQRSEPDNVPKYPIVQLAIQDQLGLRLEKRNAPIEVVVVDRVEKEPVEN